MHPSHAHQPIYNGMTDNEKDQVSQWPGENPDLNPIEMWCQGYENIPPQQCERMMAIQ